MTDRVRVLTVYLDQDYREDDVEPIRDAISLLRGVFQVGHLQSRPDDNINQHIAKQELRKKLIKVLL